MLPVFMHHTEWICDRAIYIEAALSWAVDALQLDCDQPNLQLNTDPPVKIFCPVNTSTQLIGLWEMNIIRRELLKKFGEVPSSVLLHPLTLKWVVQMESAVPWPEILTASTCFLVLQLDCFATASRHSALCRSSDIIWTAVLSTSPPEQ
jgi:hypothetical protein